MWRFWLIVVIGLIVNGTTIHFLVNNSWTALLIGIGYGIVFGLGGFIWWYKNDQN